MDIANLTADELPHIIALRRAIEIAGNQTLLAEGIARFLNRPKFKQQTVSYWLKNKILLESQWWSAIEHVTGGEVTAADLRPDVFRRDQPTTTVDSVHV